MWPERSALCPNRGDEQDVPVDKKVPECVDYVVQIKSRVTSQSLECSENTPLYLRWISIFS
jgi:hypothetical protein